MLVFLSYILKMGQIKNSQCFPPGILSAEKTGLFVLCCDDFAAHILQGTVFATHKRHSLNVQIHVSKHSEGGIPCVRTG